MKKCFNNILVVRLSFKKNKNKNKKVQSGDAEDCISFPLNGVRDEGKDHFLSFLRMAHHSVTELKFGH